MTIGPDTVSDLRVCLLEMDLHEIEEDTENKQDTAKNTAI